MKKIAIVIILMILSINIIGSATEMEPVSGSDRDTLLSNLVGMGIIDDSQTLTPDDSVSRRFVLDVLYRIYYTYTSEAEYTSVELTRDWADVSNNSRDSDLVNFMYGFEVLKGRITEDGKLYADLDSNISREEALMFFIRFLNKRNGNIDALIQRYAEENECSDNVICLFAQECGLINYTPAYDNSFIVAPCDIDNPKGDISFYEIVGIVNRLLYMPMRASSYTSDYGYRADAYYITLCEEGKTERILKYMHEGY